MNILFIKHFFVGFMFSEIPRVSLFGHCPTDTVRIRLLSPIHITLVSLKQRIVTYTVKTKRSLDTFRV